MFSPSDDEAREELGTSPKNDNPSTEQQFPVDEDGAGRSQREQERDGVRQPSETPREGDPPLPAPSLTALASNLAMQALAAMGLLLDPQTGKVERKLNRARHLIDTIDLLWEKTRGNLTTEESQALEQMLHELRLTFIQVQNLGDTEAGPEPEAPSQ